MKILTFLLGGTAAAFSIISGSAVARNGQVTNCVVSGYTAGGGNAEITKPGVAASPMGGSTAGGITAINYDGNFYRVATGATAPAKFDPVMRYSRYADVVAGSLIKTSYDGLKAPAVMTVDNRGNAVGGTALSELRAYDRPPVYVPKPGVLFVLGTGLLGLGLAVRAASIKTIYFRHNEDADALRSNRRGGNTMPSLKVGCRVIHKNGGSAVLKAYDGRSSKPWLLEMPLRSLWASHDEFYNPDHAPAKSVYAVPEPLKVHPGFRGGPANESLAFNIFGMFFRRLSFHAHASPADHD